MASKNPPIDWSGIRDNAAWVLYRAFRTACQTFIGMASATAILNRDTDTLSLAASAALAAGLSVLWNALATWSREA